MHPLVSRSIFVILSALLFSAGCQSMTPEARARADIFWDAAKACETRYRTLHIDRIDPDGNVNMHADADSRQELPAFNECYRQGIQAQIEARRKAGQTVPEMPPGEPTADLD